MAKTKKDPKDRTIEKLVEIIFAYADLQHSKNFREDSARIDTLKQELEVWKYLNGEK